MMFKAIKSISVCKVRNVQNARNGLAFIFKMAADDIVLRRKSRALNGKSNSRHSTETPEFILIGDQFLCDDTATVLFIA